VSLLVPMLLILLPYHAGRRPHLLPLLYGPMMSQRQSGRESPMMLHTSAEGTTNGVGKKLGRLDGPAPVGARVAHEDAGRRNQEEKVCRQRCVSSGSGWATAPPGKHIEGHCTAHWVCMQRPIPAQAGTLLLGSAGEQAGRGRTAPEEII